MSIRPDFAARLGKFFEEYGHHYTSNSDVNAAAQSPQMPPGVTPDIDSGAPAERVAPTENYQPGEPVHHAHYQPRESGQFAGPPHPAWYKMQDQA